MAVSEHDLHYKYVHICHILFSFFLQLNMITVIHPLTLFCYSCSFLVCCGRSLKIVYFYGKNQLLPADIGHRDGKYGEQTVQEHLPRLHNIGQPPVHVRSSILSRQAKC
jgi:hypothetical protein